MSATENCKTHKSAHSADLCPSLARIKEILTNVLGGENVDLWLNLPHAELDSKTPQSIIDEGRVDIVLDMLESALLGIPA